VTGTESHHSMREFPIFARWPAWALALLALAGLALALDGDLFWDEPGYLYIAAYIGAPDFLDGTFQPTGIENFYLPKILHLCFVKLVVAFVGPGTTALGIIMGTYAVLAGASMLLAYAALRRLLPDVRFLRAATILTTLSPMILYLAFKTLPEVPAFFFATLALYAVVRNLGEQFSLRWLALAALALAGLALTRHSLALLLVGFTVAALAFPPNGLPRQRVLWRTALAAAAGVAVTIAILTALGISLERYVLASSLFVKEQPVLLRIVSTVLEFGVLWLLVPVAFAACRHPAFGFLFVWFLIATVPILWLFSHVESRYLMQNLVPFIGLAALALDWLAGTTMSRSLSRAPAGAWLAAGSAALLLFANWCVLRLMPAEVNVWHMARIVDQVRQERQVQGSAPQRWLTAYSYTDFHYLAFAYPDLKIYKPTSTAVPPAERDPRYLREDAYYGGGRLVGSMEDLRRLDGQLVYVGFGETFMVANARRVLDRLPGIDSERVLPRDGFLDHFATSWLWGNPEIEFEPLYASGPYKVYEVRPKQSAKPD
jgi:hypothetical protein